MSVPLTKRQMAFQLPNQTYINVSLEEPNLRQAPSQPEKAGWFRRMIEAFRTWRRDQQAMAELRMMSDRELADMGLSRADIHRIGDPAFADELNRRGLPV